MPAAESFYPPSVSGVPPDLTVANANYRRSVVIVLVCLVLFLLFYLALVAASGWLFYVALTYPLEGRGRGPILLKIGSVAITAMLFLFTVKGLFKRHTVDRDLHVELPESEHPELYQFIRRLCEETKAPFPYKVYASPEVNAAVFYDSSLLNLVFPTRKNLLIGLGLVNSLTLCEFKAVLAHEFGHFAQSSMRLGSYVYQANRIIADMVYHRDYFDRLLAQWRAIGDLRVSIFGHLLYGIVWILRMLLTGAFRGINFVEAALSRQMEFHADLVAVSVTGSDSLIHALKRLDFANRSLAQAAEDLRAAAHHQLYSKDLFYHQTHAAMHLRKVEDKPELGAPPPLPEDPSARVQVFEPGDDGIPSMWASHPPNYDREMNAKRHYVRSIEDARSPWILFRGAERLRETMSRRFYQEHLEVPASTAFDDPTKVQQFIDEEHAETTQDPRYLGLYDGRYVEPGDLAALVSSVQQSPWPEERLSAAHRRLYEQEYKEWLEKHLERQREYQLLRALSEGEARLKGKTFPFRGTDRSRQEVPQLLETVEQELEADRQWLNQFDAEVFQAHYQMAAVLGKGDERELWSRCQFHLAAQEILRSMNSQRAVMENLFAHLGQRSGNLQEEEHKQVMELFRTARAEVQKALASAQILTVPPLKNIDPGTTLAAFLLQEPVVEDLNPAQDSISGEWVNRMMRQLVAVQDKVRRLDLKSLGAILALQARIAGEWQEQCEARLQTTVGRVSESRG